MHIDIHFLQKIIDGVLTFFGKPKPKSIYEYIKSSIDKDSGELPSDFKLLQYMDQENYQNENGLTFAPGLVDVLFGGPKKSKNDELYYLLLHKSQSDVIEKWVSQNFSVKLVDETLAMIIKRREINLKYLNDLACKFTTESTIVSAVKLGIALSGILNFDFEYLRDKLIDLSRYDEFSLYCVVAFMNKVKNPELILWDIAKHVHGWGRIQTIWKMKNISNEKIKDWLILEGYKNNIMLEEVIYHVVIESDLIKKMRSNYFSIDRKFISVLSEIINALIIGGPSKDINDLVNTDAVFVIKEYLRIVTSFTNKYNLIEILNTVITIKKYLESSNANKYFNSSELSDLKIEIATIIDDKEWKLSIEKIFNSNINNKSDNYHELYLARKTAENLKIDIWEKEKQLIEMDKKEYYWIIYRKDLLDDERVDWIFRFAESNIDLDKIATGARDEIGLGPRFADHMRLGRIVRMLENYPDSIRGYKFIKYALNSPVNSNRIAALDVIEKVKNNNERKKFRKLLENSLISEPKENIREKIKKLLDQSLFAR